MAGPIRGAPDWQYEAIKKLFSLDSDLVIASPRWETKDKISDRILSGYETYFEGQRAWERHYQDIASKTGAILFWLPGAPGLMTRIELGQCIANYRHDHSVRFCVGSDGYFQDLETIKYDLSLDAPHITVKKTLDETCAEAVRIVLRK